MGATPAVPFGLNFWQSLAVGLAAPAVSYGLVGLVGIAGKRGGAPGMTLSRVVFGRRGNLLPGSPPALVVTRFAISGLGISAVRTCSTWATCLCGGFSVLVLGHLVADTDWGRVFGQPAGPTSLMITGVALIAAAASAGRRRRRTSRAVRRGRPRRRRSCAIRWAAPASSYSL
jgi:NCS1 family nucleobase:cation symporter-1